MKINQISNLFFAFVLVVAMLSLTPSHAEGTDSKGPNFQIALSQSDSDVIKLVVNKKDDSSLRVIVKDKSGQVYFSEIVGANDTMYRKFFGLGGMKDGVYYLELSNRKSKIVREFEIGTKQDRTIAVQ